MEGEAVTRKLFAAFLLLALIVSAAGLSRPGFTSVSADNKAASPGKRKITDSIGRVEIEI